MGEAPRYFAAVAWVPVSTRSPQNHYCGGLRRVKSSRKISLTFSFPWHLGVVIFLLCITADMWQRFYSNERPILSKCSRVQNTVRATQEVKHEVHIGIFTIPASRESTVTSYTRDWTNWKMYTKKRTISFSACCNNPEEFCRNVQSQWREDIFWVRLSIWAPLLMFIFIDLLLTGFL